MVKKINGMFILLSLFSTLLLASPVLANIGDNDFGMMSGFCGGGMGYGMGLFGSVFMILVIVALVLLIVWLYKQIQEPKRRK